MVSEDSHEGSPSGCEDEETQSVTSEQLEGTDDGERGQSKQINGE
jgi:hypothetical protein